MKKFENFLFFYSVAVITIVIFSFGLYSPTPLNLITSLTLIPIIFYFWIRFTSPAQIEADRWSYRFVLAIIILTLLGIYAFRIKQVFTPNKNEVALKKQLAQALENNQKLNMEISKLKNLPSPTPIETKSDTSLSDIIADIESGDHPTNSVWVKDGTKDMNIYELQNKNSKVLGKIQPNINYPYIQTSNNWYKIVASDTQTGWVHETQVDAN